jgi:hypothetical protein
VKILDECHYGTVAVVCPQDAPEILEHTPLRRLRVDAWGGPRRVGDAHEVEHRGQDLREGGIEQKKRAGDLFASREIAVLLGDTEALAEHLQDRAKRDRAAVRDRLCLDHGDPFRPAALDELEAEAALAGTGGRNDRDRLALSMLGACRGGLEQAHLVIATDEARETAGAGAVEARAQTAEPLESIGVNRRARALYVERTQILELEVALDSLRGRSGDVDLASLGERLYALRECFSAT